MARTAANTSVNELMGGGMIPVDSLPTNSRSKIMKAVRLERKDMTNNMIAMTNAIDANTKLMTKHGKDAHIHVKSHISAIDKLLPSLIKKHVSSIEKAVAPRKDTLLQFFKDRQGKEAAKSTFNNSLQGKYNQKLLDSVVQLHKFDTHDTKKFYSEMLEYQRYSSRFLRILSGHNGLIDRITEGIIDSSRIAITGLVGTAMRGLGKIFGSIVMIGPIKLAANAVRSFFGIFKVIPALLAGTKPGEKVTIAAVMKGALSLSRLTKMAVLIGGLALIGASQKDEDVVKKLDIQGRKVDWVDRISVGVGRILDDVTFGLSDFLSEKIFGESLDKVLDGYGHAFEKQIESVITFISTEFRVFKAAPWTYIKAVPGRMWDTVIEGFNYIASSTVFTDIKKKLFDEIDSFKADPMGSLKAIGSSILQFTRDALVYSLNTATTWITNMMPSKADSVEAIKSASASLGENAAAIVKVMYDWSAAQILNMFKGTGLDESGESVAKALFKGAGVIIYAVGAQILTSIGNTLTSEDFWQPITKGLESAFVYAANATINAVATYVEVLMKSSLLVSLATGKSLEESVIGVSSYAVTVIKRAKFFLDSISGPFAKISKFFEGAQIALTQFTGNAEFIRSVEHGAEKIEAFVKSAEEVKGFFAPVIRMFNTLRSGFGFIGNLGEVFAKVAEPLMSFIKIGGKVLSKIAWPLQVILSIFDFMEGFGNAGALLDIDPSKLTFSDKIIAGFGAVIGGVLDMPVHLISWVANYLAEAMGFGSIGTLDNLGQVFGYDNTAKMLKGVVEKAGDSLGAGFDFFKQLAHIPWSIFKSVTNYVGGLFGFDIFADDPDATLSAAMDHGKTAGVDYAKALLGLPYTMAAWVINRIGKMFGFDPLVPDSIDKVLENIKTFSISDMLSHTVDAIGSWFSNIFDSDKILKAITGHLPSWLGGSGPDAPIPPTVQGNAGFNTPPVQGPANPMGGPSRVTSFTELMSTIPMGLQYAEGGVIDKPIVFDVGGGQRGMAGERGKEAILPLTNTRDGLGVNAKIEFGSESMKSFTSSIDDLIDIMKDVGNTIREKGPGVVDSVSQGASNAYNSARPSLTQAFNSVSAGASSAYASAKPIVSSAADSAMSAAKTGMTGISGFIDDVSKKVGVSPDFMHHIMRQESGGNPNDVSDTGATGLFQFTQGTWNDISKKHAKEIESMGGQPSMVTNGMPNDPRKDPKTNSIYAALLTKDNQDMLGTSDPGLLYLAHFLGPGVAREVSSALSSGKGDTPAKDLPSMYHGGSATNNSVINGKSVKDLYAWAAKIGGGAADATVQYASKAGSAMGDAASSAGSAIGGAAGSLYSQVSNFLDHKSTGLEDAMQGLGLNMDDFRSKPNARHAAWQQEQQASLAHVNSNLALHGLAPVGQDAYGYTHPQADADMTAPRDPTSPIYTPPAPTPNKPARSFAPTVSASNQAPAFSPLANIPLILSDIGLALVGVEGLA